MEEVKQNEQRELAWEKLKLAVATIVVECGYVPVPIYREIFSEVVLTKPAVIEMYDATEKDIEEAKQMLVDLTPKVE